MTSSWRCVAGRRNLVNLRDGMREYLFIECTLIILRRRRELFDQGPQESPNPRIVPPPTSLRDLTIPLTKIFPCGTFDLILLGQIDELVWVCMWETDESDRLEWIKCRIRDAFGSSTDFVPMIGVFGFPVYQLKAVLEVLTSRQTVSHPP